MCNLSWTHRVVVYISNTPTCNLSQTHRVVVYISNTPTCNLSQTHRVVVYISNTPTCNLSQTHRVVVYISNTPMWRMHPAEQYSYHIIIDKNNLPSTLSPACQFLCRWHCLRSLPPMTQCPSRPRAHGNLLCPS